MKTGTIDKMKFMVLKNALGLPKYQVIGLLEGLWYLTATNAQDGAVGRFSDIEICAWLEWPNNPDVLISAFVKSGFLDRCPSHRLIVHDWEEHAPQHVKGNISKHHKNFAKVKSENSPVAASKGDSLGVSLGDSPGSIAPNQTKPNLTKPNQTNTRETVNSPRENDPPPNVSSSKMYFDFFVGTLNRLGVTVKLGYVQAWIDDEVTIEDLEEATAMARNYKPPPDLIPAKYLDTIIRANREKSKTATEIGGKQRETVTGDKPRKRSLSERVSDARRDYEASLDAEFVGANDASLREPLDGEAWRDADS